MQLGTYLKQAEAQLAHAGIETARLDALVLLEDVLGKDRSWLLANPDTIISPADQATLKKLFRQRANHTPLSYLRNKTEFYGREFVVTNDVLEPRPESETMIDVLKSLPDLGPKPNIADVGTGSGALGITAIMELPQAEATLIDIDETALSVAKMNVDKFTIKVVLKQQNLLEGDNADYDILLCNLPYVPDDYSLNLAATHEPKLAIFGGEDGLNVYRELFEQLRDRNHKVLYILTESLPDQHGMLAAIAKHSHYALVQENDFIQVFRRTH